MEDPISDLTAEPGSHSARSSGELLFSLVVALVLFANPVAAWRASDLGSRAGDAERLGLIQSIQRQDFLNID